MPGAPKRRLRFFLGIPGGPGVEYSEEWEEQPALYYGSLVAVRACDGRFWQSNRDDRERIVALASHIRSWELFRIVAKDDEFVSKNRRAIHYGDHIALQCLRNSQFVGASVYSATKELTARVPWVREWEIFRLEKTPRVSVTARRVRFGSWFALRACNDKFVSYEQSETKLLHASADAISERESFVLICPPADAFTT